MAIPFEELNKVNPSSIIELFELELTVGLHIPTGNPNNLATVFRFHGGAKGVPFENNQHFGKIRFNSQDYQRIAVKAEGFEETSSGALPRPTLTFSNLGGISRTNEQGIESTIPFSDFLAFINDVTPGNDLLNAKVTRLLPLASSIANFNFTGTNPYGTPSADRLEDRIYFIDRKAVENREIVQFELSNQLDMELKKIPARVVTRDLFPSAGRFI
tara:strand:+ start:569 stop:1213 length:645 start_codon:yes stop_codon:yes gene_type:complete